MRRYQVIIKMHEPKPIVIEIVAQTPKKAVEEYLKEIRIRCAFRVAKYTSSETYWAEVKEMIGLSDGSVTFGRKHMYTVYFG